jgi:hypothetical protein
MPFLSAFFPLFQIVTGGEDCRYRLWDGQGLCFYNYQPQALPAVHYTLLKP